MASDPVVEYWAEIMRHTPFTPEVMAQWKRVIDQGLEAWSRALSEVMATEDFAELLGTSLEQWLQAQAPFTSKPAPLTGQADHFMVLAAELRHLEQRGREVEARLASNAQPTASVASRQAPRRTPRRRAA